MKISRTKSHRRKCRNKSNGRGGGASGRAAMARRRRRREESGEKRGRNIGSRTSILPPPILNKLSLNSVRESINQYLCDPQWFRDTASRGLTTIVTPKSQFRTNPSDHGPFNTNIPIRSTTIGKSRVARDLITMHTSWRSNSDIACVTRKTHLPKTHQVLWPEICHTIISSDCIGYPRTMASGESSTTKHRLLHASGPYPIPPPDDPN
ncbi:hypothetical protein F511_39794 [Dorcoceras hygrometricum]|uniref:Uncharacterized protein n=1 Tax=Dorcoceras hygrometricum TaxID=472368 RepID=A0A2Z7BHM4_9LAMI|nr:hypothetical protein F511_39794 [Dorcoceras hygrometricum]